MVYGLMIHSVDSCQKLYFSVFFSPEGNDSRKKNRNSRILRRILDEHLFTRTTSGTTSNSGARGSSNRGAGTSQYYYGWLDTLLGGLGQAGTQAFGGVGGGNTNSGGVGGTGGIGGEGGDHDGRSDGVAGSGRGGIGGGPLSFVPQLRSAAEGGDGLGGAGVGDGGGATAHQSTEGILRLSDEQLFATPKVVVWKQV